VPAKLTRDGDSLLIALDPRDGARFRDAKEQIKEFPGRRWDPETKFWAVPATAQNAERALKTLLPECDQELLDWITREKANEEESLTSPLPDDARSKLLVPWAYQRCPWQPEEVNDEKVVGLLAMQRAAVEAMAERGRTILADDMGLGKTFEAISAVEEWCLRNGQVTGPKLVVAPASVKGGWARELRRWLNLPDEEVVVVQGSYSPRKSTLIETQMLGLPEGQKLTGAQVRKLILMRAIEANAWIIVNWEQLRVEKVKVKLRNGGEKTVKQMKEPLFEDTEWLAVIADEVHRAKNPKAAQTQGLWRARGEVMFGLTGTPLMNSPDELWPLLRWMWPDEYGNSTPPSKANPHGHPRVPFSTFYDEYVDYWEDHYGKKIITGVKNPDALRYVLEDKLIRRIGTSKRRRIYTPVPLNKGQQELYDEAFKVMWLAVTADAAKGNAAAIQFLDAAVESDGDVPTLIQIPNGAARLVRLQQIIENAALVGGADDSGLMDYFEQRFEDSRPEPWVHFTKFKMSAHLLAARFESKYGAKVGVYTGDTSPEARTRMEDAFQKGALDAIVGTIAAMKEGITLTRGHLMGFLSRDWVPDVNEQCEAREDRMGQQREVLVDIPLAVGTVAEGRVQQVNKIKEGIVRTVVPKDKIKEEHAS
jgi:SWI/SNF-related matrix-associated actin-dependent regulator of chromatin subfamily A-like protein 1